MMKLRQHFAIPLVASFAITAMIPLSALAFGFGGVQRENIPEEAQTALEACRTTIHEQYAIPMPEKPENGKGMGFGRRGTMPDENLTEEQRTAFHADMKACMETVATQYNLELPAMPERPFGRGMGTMGMHGRGMGEFAQLFAGVQDLSDEQKTSLLEELRSVIAKYQTSNAE